MPRFRIAPLIASLTTLAALWLALAPPALLAGKAAPAAALTVFTVGLFATNVVPEFVAALAFFFLAMLFHVAPPDVVFAGFQAAALWLVLGGLVMGAAVGVTGLGARLARRLAPLFGDSYPGIIAGVVLVNVAVAFVMPSSLGRQLLILPIMMALARDYGFEPGSRGFVGIVLASAFGNFMPAFTILPANIPNVVLAGAGETLYGIVPVWGKYLWLHFPVLGALKALIIVGLVIVMFPATPRRAPHSAERPGPMSRDERLLAVLLVVALALWATDFLHHVSPAWVALGAGTVCLLPRVGMVTPKTFAERVNFGSFLYLAGILGIGAVVAASGLADLLARTLIAAGDFAPGQPVRTFAAVSLLSTALGVFTTQPGLPAVLAPLAGDIASAAGQPVEAVLMMLVVGFSVVIFPYQAPPMVIALQLSRVPMVKALRLSLALTAITLAVLLPLDYLWWRLIGWIG